MKKIALALIISCSLLVGPVPVRASDNPMIDMMRVMMEMFLWMMGGNGRYSGYNSPYSFSNASPYSSGSLANPWASGLYGLGSLYSPYMSGLGYSPYGNQYPNLYGYQNPYNPGNGLQNYYNRPNPYNRFDAYYKRYRWPYQTPPVVLQPIIIKPQGNAAKKKMTQASSTAGTAKPPTVNKPDSSNSSVLDDGMKTRLQGAWQGVNGEYLELGDDSFRMLSGNEYMEGDYQVSNGIMKIKLVSQNDPVYMRIRLNGRELIFESEDGQMMLFRHLGPVNDSYSPRAPMPRGNNPWRSSIEPYSGRSIL